MLVKLQSRSVQLNVNVATGGWFGGGGGGGGAHDTVTAELADFLPGSAVAKTWKSPQLVLEN